MIAGYGTKIASQFPFFIAVLASHGKTDARREFESGCDSGYSLGFEATDLVAHNHNLSIRVSDLHHLETCAKHFTALWQRDSGAVCHEIGVAAGMYAAIFMRCQKLVFADQRIFDKVLHIVLACHEVPDLDMIFFEQVAASYARELNAAERKRLEVLIDACRTQKPRGFAIGALNW